MEEGRDGAMSVRMTGGAEAEGAGGGTTIARRGQRGGEVEESVAIAEGD